jgi:hypothetical protein
VSADGNPIELALSESIAHFPQGEYIEPSEAAAYRIFRKANTSSRA